MTNLRDKFGRFAIGYFHRGGAGDPGEISRIGDSDRFGMLVLYMMGLCVNLLVFLEVLWSLEWLFADLQCQAMRTSRDARVKGGTTSQMWGFNGVWTISGRQDMDLSKEDGLKHLSYL